MSQFTDNAQQAAKVVGDVTAASIVVGTLIQWLPAIAALFTIIWTGIRIWETDTIRGLTGRQISRAEKGGE